MSEIIQTDSPDPADIAVIADGLRAYNTAMAGYDDYRPFAVFVADPVTGKVIGGLYGASSRGQLRVDRFFLPQELRRDRLGSRLLKMAEEEGRRRRCTRVLSGCLQFLCRPLEVHRLCRDVGVFQPGTGIEEHHSIVWCECAIGKQLVVRHRDGRAFRRKEDAFVAGPIENRSQNHVVA